MAEHSESSRLIPPLPAVEPSKVDLEAGPGEQIQCRICLETEGRDFISPCKCKGTSKYVHRECLDHWRSVKEGVAFAHCTTCKAPYYLRVHSVVDRKRRTLKFRFFVTRDILGIFLAVQIVIASLAYVVYSADGYQKFWLRHTWGFDGEISFYYICGYFLNPQFAYGNHGNDIREDREVMRGLKKVIQRLEPNIDNQIQAFNELDIYSLKQQDFSDTTAQRAIKFTNPGALLFFALLGLSGCFITCYDQRVRNDLAQPCRELCHCCCHPGLCSECHLPGTVCMWTDCTTGFESCASTAGECGSCLGGAGEAGLPVLFIMALIVLGLFTVIGIFYSVLVATMVGQRIWQRHYHILAKRMLTKEYVVEDVDDEMMGTDWSTPPLPPEHVQQLKALGLM